MAAISNTQNKVLRAIADCRDVSVPDICRFMQDQGWSSSPASIYPALEILECAGLVAVRWGVPRTSGNRPRLYRLTELGSDVVEDLPWPNQTQWDRFCTFVLRNVVGMEEG